VEVTKAVMIAKMGVNLNYPHGEPDTLEICQRFVTGEYSVLYTSVSDAWKTMAVVEACYESSVKKQN
jgi:hypothetical protein